MQPDMGLERSPRYRVIAVEDAACANRTRRKWRTRGFFRFLPVANETAAELLARPARILAYLPQQGARIRVNAGPFAMGCRC
ncbi:hypothetical protein ABIE78_006481 [Sinorhizobium fredii]|jgi:hypothetical protein